MKLLVMFMTAFGVLTIAPFVASAQPSTTFRDSMGRTTGTATTKATSRMRRLTRTLKKRLTNDLR